MVSLRAPAMVFVVGIAVCARPLEAQSQDPDETRANATEASRLRARGIELAYNLDRTQALEAFRRAASIEPDDSTAFRLAAAATWMQLLFDQGAISVDDYLGETRTSVKRRSPDQALASAFHEDLSRAIALADTRLRDRPKEAEAHFQAGAAAACLASYTATIEGRVYASFNLARRAYREHERAMEIDPHRADAGLTVGLYRYAVASLSLPFRLLANLAGIGGGHERGISLVETAASSEGDARASALFTLILIYNRERRYDDALSSIRQLQRLFPRNRLLWLEAGTTALRAKQFLQARAALEQGFERMREDRRPRALGEESRWRLAYGQALLGLEDFDAAGRELRTALSIAAADWVRGRAHRDLGKLADVAGDRGRALEEYRQARAICAAADDNDCAAESAQLLRTPYQ